MRYSKILAAAACATAVIIPANTTAARAQTAPQVSPSTYVALIKVLNGNIATADCSTLGSALRVTKLVDAETTRSGLVRNVNNAIGPDAELRLVTAPTVNALGDRALACGIVKQDPVTLESQLQQLSSTLSSRMGLPDYWGVMPIAAR